MTIRLNFVSPERKWILGKITDKLAAELPKHGIETTVNAKNYDDFDVNCWINWFTWSMAKRQPTPCNILYFTHQNVNNSDEFVADLVNAADQSICMSEWERQKLISIGVRPHKATSILPAMEPDAWPLRPLKVGITCRYYDDGRRCDDMILDVAERGALDGWRVAFVGEGWEALIFQLQKYGVDCKNYPGSGDYLYDYQINHKIVPQLDYLWNVGRDTTLGVLDALATGIPIISQPTSYAVEFATESGAAHWYETTDELERVFVSLKARQRAIGDVARSRTWAAYGADVAALVKRVVGA
jgi:hypothetical protein